MFAACLFAFPTSAFAEQNIQLATNEVVVYIDADTTYGDCANATIVVVPEDQLVTVKDYAKNLVDDGKILYIQDTSQNKEALANYFSIPKATRSVYNNMPHIAATIYKASDCYVFSYIYVQIDASNSETSNCSYSLANAQEIIPIEDGLASARDLYEEANHAPSLVNVAKGIPSGANEIYSDVVRIYGPNSSYLGDGIVTQYLYKKGNGIVNGQQMYIFDTVTSFKGAPNSDKYLQSYQGRLHCNISGHTLIDYSILPSNTSSTSTVQVSGGGLSGGTSWTFTPDSQIITTNASPSNNYVDYFGSPQVIRYGHSWEMLPGIRAATSNGAGSRGAFSKLTIPVLGIFGQVGSYDIEVGGWF